ncbi:MAG: ATP-binding protein, partial [Paramuribaculum sp.]|nr:ATP-binding protein [Paramuribaculum sp.]
MSRPDLTLPPSVAVPAPVLPEGTATVVIVGANGAGKSRFADRMARDCAPAALTLSALRALYERQPLAEITESAEAHYIDRLYAEAVRSGMSSPDLTSQLDRLLTLLMRDEMVNLIDYKLSRTSGHPDEPLPATRLDRVIDVWHHIFPDNKIFISRGSLLFNRVGADASDVYSPVKLSAGEKAVIYYIAALTYAPAGAVVFVDSPEMFLHPTVMQSLWNR